MVYVSRWTQVILEPPKGIPKECAWAPKPSPLDPLVCVNLPGDYIRDKSLECFIDIQNKFVITNYFTLMNIEHSHVIMND